jgi:hypothetical protein
VRITASQEVARIDWEKVEFTWDLGLSMGHSRLEGIGVRRKIVLSDVMSNRGEWI